MLRTVRHDINNVQQEGPCLFWEWVSKACTISLLRTDVKCKCILTLRLYITWWGHNIDIFSTLLALCEGNLQFPEDSLHKDLVILSFDVFFVVCLKNMFNKQLSFITPMWYHCNDTKTLWIFQNSCILYHAIFLFPKKNIKMLKVFSWPQEGWLATRQNNKKSQVFLFVFVFFQICFLEKKMFQCYIRFVSEMFFNVYLALIHKQLETHGCIISTVATDGLVP